ncbi:MULTISPECIES: twin-arginine translocase subunit TatC [Brevundimonas]|jgi:sec-independent protein translocase protein TatC|uniref:twin-arginine translocase subunit TatC n=1 Tax=Brevundimonas TaxID=41275 RepID=UPI000E0BB502|nr:MULTISPECIES: twin-arginine translocase subunit TatC [Brevundimonas]MBD3832138.1 twin-arginine translocase subunit TatC [Brevundimonas sp.]NWE52171.1 twin-arginine translocase subunit TatC [Brevundimonas sp. P7753]WQE38450.1 twin-arginine translocase subunit TatC [Brevundimonas bullata]
MTSFDRDEAEIEASRAPLMDHLIELRGRLLICVVAFIVAFIGCFAVADKLYLFLVQPYVVSAAFHQTVGAHGHVSPFDLILGTARLIPVPAVDDQSVKLIYTAPLEFLFTKMKLAGLGAVIIAFPVLAWQLYRFVAPGLYRNEKGAFLPFLIAAPVLFLLGAALVYFVMLPFVMWFSLSQQIIGQGVSAELLPKVSDYLNLVTALILAFGLCFQLPVVMTLLGLAGMISSKVMAQGRRYAIVAVVVVAAVVTPPDPISQLMLAVPMVLLYEVSIWCVRIIEMRRKKADAAEEATV